MLCDSPSNKCLSLIFKDRKKDVQSACYNFKPVLLTNVSLQKEAGLIGLPLSSNESQTNLEKRKPLTIRCFPSSINLLYVNKN